VSGFGLAEAVDDIDLVPRDRLDARTSSEVEDVIGAQRDYYENIVIKKDI
jgi:hypothetical protein